MSHVKSRRALWLIPTLFLLGSCGPKITSFTALPKSVCEDAEFTMKWEMRGDPSLTASLHRATQGAEGTPDTLVMVLTAGTGEDPPTRTEDVLVFPARFTTSLFFETTVDGTTVHAADEANPGKWPANFVVEAVASASDIAISIRHAGAEALVDADGTPSATLAGLPVLGRWELEATVPAGAEAPEVLVLNITAACGS